MNLNYKKMKGMDWKDQRIDEINKEISQYKDPYARQCTAINYIEEYHAIKNSNAKTFEEFKQQQLKQGKK